MSAIFCHACNRTYGPEFPTVFSPDGTQRVCPSCSSEFCETVTPSTQTPRAFSAQSGDNTTGRVDPAHGTTSATRTMHFGGPGRNVEVTISTTAIPISMLPGGFGASRMGMPMTTGLFSMPGLPGVFGGFGFDVDLGGVLGGAAGDDFDHIISQIMNAYQPPTQPTARHVVDSLPRLRVPPADGQAADAAPEPSTSSTPAEGAAAAAAASTPATAAASAAKQRYASCKAGEACPVCHDTFEAGAEVLEMPCQHCFHDDCLLPWLQEHNTCPVCRYTLEVEGEQQRQARQQRRQHHRQQDLWHPWAGQPQQPLAHHTWHEQPQQPPAPQWQQHAMRRPGMPVIQPLGAINQRPPAEQQAWHQEAQQRAQQTHEEFRRQERQAASSAGAPAPSSSSPAQPMQRGFLLPQRAGDTAPRSRADRNNGSSGAGARSSSSSRRTGDSSSSGSSTRPTWGSSIQRGFFGSPAGSRAGASGRSSGSTRAEQQQSAGQTGSEQQRDGSYSDDGLPSLVSDSESMPDLIPDSDHSSDDGDSLPTLMSTFEDQDQEGTDSECGPPSLVSEKDGRQASGQGEAAPAEPTGAASISRAASCSTATTTATGSSSNSSSAFAAPAAAAAAAADSQHAGQTAPQQQQQQQQQQPGAPAAGQPSPLQCTLMMLQRAASGEATVEEALQAAVRDLSSSAGSRQVLPLILDSLTALSSPRGDGIAPSAAQAATAASSSAAAGTGSSGGTDAAAPPAVAGLSLPPLSLRPLCSPQGRKAEAAAPSATAPPSAAGDAEAANHVTHQQGELPAASSSGQRGSLQAPADGPQPARSAFAAACDEVRASGHQTATAEAASSNRTDQAEGRGNSAHEGTHADSNGMQSRPSGGASLTSMVAGAVTLPMRMLVGGISGVLRRGNSQSAGSSSSEGGDSRSS